MRDEEIALAGYQTAFGWVGMAVSGQGLCHLTLPQESQAQAATELRREFPAGQWGATGALEGLGDRLRRYFAGDEVDFADILLDLSRGTDFQRAVWSACRSIPRGQVRTYRWLAQEAGSPRASRAAGQAMAHNPIPIIIPCHRVVGSNGSLTGFGGGLEMKRRLLELERAIVPGGPIQ